MMDQPTFADVDYTSKKRKTRRERFLDRMDGLIPWATLPLLPRTDAQEWFRSGEPPYCGPLWPDLARFIRRDLRSKPGMRRSREGGNDGGLFRRGPVAL